jgi:glutaminyl-tRNA synthetase
MFLLLTMVSGKMQEKKVAVAAAAPPEELNPYTIFPQPEENFKVCD